MDKESKLITAIAVTPANAHDSEAIFVLIDQQPEKRRSQEVTFC